MISEVDKDWRPKAGDLVQVRSKEEILATLDDSAQFEGLPFMPQMLQYCGQQLRVVASAHKTCDVIGGTGRSLPGGVHLETRCDGKAYGGCQASCLIFWKTAWLQPLRQGSEVPTEIAGMGRRREDASSAGRCSEADLFRGTKMPESGEIGDVTYVCQATRVAAFTRPLPWWNIRQYIEDYRSGNIAMGRFARGFVYQVYLHGTQAWRNKIGRPARALYDLFQKVVGGIPFPQKRGRLPEKAPAPVTNLNLQPGDVVRIKSHEEILATIHAGGLNRGLLFDKEMVPFCGKVSRVKARVNTFVNERNGKMTTLKTPAVILEGVWCQSRYSNNKMFCPRAIYSWWREVWLEKVADQEDVRLAQEACDREIQYEVKNR